MTLKTSLYLEHQKLGAKLVSFAGWEMPVRYSGIPAEHLAVRQAAGIFDVSHMGEIFVEGKQAQDFLDFLTPNLLRNLKDGRAQYSALTKDNGTLVDDIIIYRFNPERFFICVNASNTKKDFEWLNSHNDFDCRLSDRSSKFSQIALQGPRALEITSELFSRDLGSEISLFHFAARSLLGEEVIVARTGYTGEDGFEFFLPWAKGPDLWQALLEVGAKHGLLPCGLGARDSLRLEACYPLYGHELCDDYSAIESGLSWIVKPSKGKFLGKEVLERQQKEGSPRSLIGFEVREAGIARQGDRVLNADNNEIGLVTSGTMSPLQKKAIGLAIVDSAFAEIGSEVLLEVRDKKLRGIVVKRPFYKRPGQGKESGTNRILPE